MRLWFSSAGSVQADSLSNIASKLTNSGSWPVKKGSQTHCYLKFSMRDRNLGSRKSPRMAEKTSMGHQFHLRGSTCPAKRGGQGRENLPSLTVTRSHGRTEGTEIGNSFLASLGRSTFQISLTAHMQTPEFRTRLIQT
jgi:hypothetical protein